MSKEQEVPPRQPSQEQELGRNRLKQVDGAGGATALGLYLVPSPGAS